jgi:hypothetical protein
METKKGEGKKTIAALKHALAAGEERIATALVEHALVFDEAGTVLVDKKGERATVAFTPEEVRRMRGAAVFTHNHPGGTSFSLPDMLMAKRLDIGEMRVVTKDTVYVVHPPQGGWSALPLGALLNAVHEADAYVEEKLLLQIHVGRITKAEANKRHWHEVWTRVAQHVGLHYTRRP